MDIYIDCKCYNENDAAEGWEVYVLFYLTFYTWSEHSDCIHRKHISITVDLESLSWQQCISILTKGKGILMLPVMCSAGTDCVVRHKNDVELHILQL